MAIDGMVAELMHKTKDEIQATVSLGWVHSHVHEIGEYLLSLPDETFSRVSRHAKSIMEFRDICAYLGFQNTRIPTVRDGIVADFVAYLELEKGISYWSIVTKGADGKQG